MRSFRRARLFVSGMAAVLVLVGISTAGAASANISHSYNSTSPVTNGSLVSLDPSKTNSVEPANSSNGQQLLGVAVATTDSLLAVDPTAGSVQVATSGTVNVLVSTLNGPIAVGDQVGVSAFSGLGMHAAPGTRVIGLAQTSFDDKSSGATTQQVTDKTGKKTTIYLGLVRVNIAIGTSSSSVDAQLNGLQKLAKSVTGHTVSMLRIVVSLVIAVVGLIALITLTYSSIYGSIISVGRNPLAKFAVFRTLGTVMIMVAITGLIAGTTIFFLLR